MDNIHLQNLLKKLKDSFTFTKFLLNSAIYLSIVSSCLMTNKPLEFYKLF